jgi:uncharacterized protein (DUF4415 family)
MLNPPVERDIVEWVKAHAQDDEVQINTVLRDYVSAHY